MKAVVFHGSPRKGNTYTATSIFMDALGKNEDVQFAEFYLPHAASHRYAYRRERTIFKGVGGCKSWAQLILAGWIQEILLWF